MIVTTPEKWDVITRKNGSGGDGMLVSLVKLLIIDEASASVPVLATHSCPVSRAESYCVRRSTCWQTVAVPSLRHWSRGRFDTWSKRKRRACTVVLLLLAGVLL
jgi:hypothetical protein